MSIAFFTALIRLANIVASFFSEKQLLDAGAALRDAKSLQKVLDANAKADAIARDVESGKLSDPFVQP